MNEDPDGAGVMVKNLRLAVFADPALLNQMATHNPYYPPAAVYQYITTVIAAVSNIHWLTH